MVGDGTGAESGEASRGDKRDSSGWPPEVMSALMKLLDALSRTGADDVRERLETLVASHGEAQGGASAVGPVTAPCRLTGTSPAVTRLKEDIARAARNDFNVVIQGETGAGKELVAQQIHLWSRRQAGPWVPLNCAALVDTLVEAELFGIEDRIATGVRGRAGKFEATHGGTLFLDEIADMPMHVQAKLLRVLQERTVERVGGHASRPLSVRVIAASNKNLKALVDAGTFRPDVYFRLNLLRIEVPPLRDRMEDLAALASVFLADHRSLGVAGIQPSALEALREYAWPGNVRELHNELAAAITRAQARGPGSEIRVTDLSEPIGWQYREVLLPAINNGDSMRTAQRRYARLVLDLVGQNKQEACRRLGISYHTLQALLGRTRTASAVESRASPSGRGRRGRAASLVSLAHSRGEPTR